ncbi:MAG: RNA methyltransferase [Gammaproteobacteria bacterium]
MKNIRIVLVNPSHPGNIGAAARAMKNMGLHCLYLVQPEKFPHPEAIYRASRADDIVQNAKVVATLDDALIGCAHVYGTSARKREMSAPVIDVREMAEMIAEKPVETAIVFGREKHGLYNEELQRCQYQVKIPTVDDYSSLNLGAAVQVVAYELYVAMQGDAPEITRSTVELATADEMEGLYQHLEKVAVATGFLNPEKPKTMMPRFRQIFNRAHLDKEDVNLIRGMLVKIDKCK